MTENAMVNWEEKMLAEASEQAANERVGVNRIAIRGGVMTYMGNEMPDNMMDCVVLESCIEQAYYSTPYDADNIVPPDCYALAPPGHEHTMGPAENVLNPIGVNCQSCPNFQWGSGRGKGKACSTRRRLAIIPASALAKPEELASAEVILLVVSVTQVKAWANYVNTVAAMHKRPTWGVITNVAVKPDAKTQYKMLFNTSALVDSELLGEVNGLREKAWAMVSQPFDMTAPVQEEEKTLKGKK